MMKKQLLLLIIATVSFISLVHADSPLTSTDFHTAYLDVPQVKTAKDKGVVDKEIVSFLRDAKIAMDVKAAVINAIGWKFDGKTNAEQFAKIAWNKTPAQLDLNALDANDLLCVGYLQALDDYFKPEKALPYLQAALKKKPKSYTIALIAALVKAQIAMDSDWCAVWKTVSEADAGRSLTEDPMRPGAKRIIFEYMGLYRDECTD